MATFTLEIKCDFAWIKLNPDGTTKCDNCSEIIYSKIYSLGISVNDKPFEEIRNKFCMCQSCFDGVDWNTKQVIDESY